MSHYKFAAFRILTPVLLCIALGSLASTGVHAANLGVTASVSCPTVPPGGTAQITIALPSPIAFTHGTIAVDLDPTVFGNISAVNVFSASGDQQGFATLQGLHANVQFGAESGGIGKLPNMPMIEITAPVLSTARVGATGSATVQSTAVWYEISGAEYNVSFQSPGVLVGSGIAIQSVVPGGGPAAAGTVVTINGLGFTKSTTLQLDAVAWSNLQLLSPSQMTFTLTGAADLTGKLLVLTDTGGVTTRYYSSLTPTSVMDDRGNSGIWPIFPVSTYTGAGLETGNFWLENDTSNSIVVTFTPQPIVCTPCAGEPLAATRQVTVPVGGLYLASYAFSPAGSYPAYGTILRASAPIRALVAPLPAFGPPALSLNRPVYASCAFDVIDYHKGDPAPAAIACTSAAFQSLAAGTQDGTSWLHVSPSSGSNTQFTVSVDPTGLAEGSYTGVVAAALVPALATYAYPQPLYSLVPLTLNVHAQPVVAATPVTWYFSPPSLSPATVNVTSPSPSVPILATTSAPWLVVTPTSATTPAHLSVSVLPSAPGDQSATLSIQGPGNTLQLIFYTESSTLPSGPTNFTFTAALGSTTPLTSSLGAVLPLAAVASTSSGGKWLTAVAAPSGSSFPTNGTLTILADPTGLATGVYQGQVIVTPSVAVAAINATTVSVTLSVWDNSALPALSVPSSLQIDLTSNLGLLLGETYFNVSSGALSIPLSITTQSDSAVTLQGQSAGTTPGSFEVTAYSSFPGTFHGSITLTAPPNSTNSAVVPVTITAPSVPAVDNVGPKISNIVNAASMLPGPISPGEIVSIFGLFPTPGTAGVSIGPDGTVNRSHYAISVLFNGIAAPMTYLSAGQINAVVPYEVAGSSTVNVQLNLGGIPSSTWSIPVAPSAPGIFTQDGTGQGAGAILNQDSSLNTPQNPASRGSIVQIFLTGEGATNPPGVTGEVTQSDIKAPTQPVTVQIGGVKAAVVSATTAPDAIAGLFQVNAIVPANAPAGAVPIVVQIGDASSQAATIFVQ